MPKLNAEATKQIFNLLINLSGECSFPDRPSDPDASWIMTLLRNGIIRKGNGDAFSVEKSDREIAYELCREATENGKSELQDGRKSASGSLLFQINGKYKEVEIEYLFSADDKFIEVAERDSSAAVKAQSEKASAPLNDALVPEPKSRIYYDVRNIVRSFQDNLNDTDSVFSSDSQEYKNLQNALKSFMDQYAQQFGNPFKVNDTLNIETLNNALQNVFKCANDYANAKAEGNKINSRRVDRLKVCAGLRGLEKRLAEAVESETAYAADPQDKEAEARLRAAEKSLRSSELIKDKLANDMLFGELKTRGPEAVCQVLKEQIDFDKKPAEEKTNETGIYDKMIASLKKSGEFRGVIGEPCGYGTNINKLTKLSKESPSELQKKFRERRKKSVERVKAATAVYKWPNAKPEQEQLNEIKSNINKLGNSTLALVCEYTLKLSDQMKRELDAVDSHFHSDAYRIFYSQISALHGKLLNNIQVALENDNPAHKIFETLTDSLRDVSDAADQYQKHHVGKKINEIGETLLKRVEVAAGMKLLNSLLTDTENRKSILSGSPEGMKNLRSALTDYRKMCAAMNEEIESVNRLSDTDTHPALDNFYPMVMGLETAKGEFSDKQKGLKFIQRTLNGTKLMKEDDPWLKIIGGAEEARPTEREEMYSKLYRVMEVAESLPKEERKAQREAYEDGCEEIDRLSKEWRKLVLDSHAAKSNPVAGNESSMPQGFNAVDETKKFIENLKLCSDTYGNFDKLAVDCASLAAVVERQCKNVLPAEDPARKTIELVKLSGTLAKERIASYGADDLVEQEAWKITASGLAAIDAADAEKAIKQENGRLSNAGQLSEQKNPEIKPDAGLSVNNI